MTQVLARKSQGFPVNAAQDAGFRSHFRLRSLTDCMIQPIYLEKVCQCYFMPAMNVKIKKIN